MYKHDTSGLTGRRVMVTSASMGVGFAVARRDVDEGARVVNGRKCFSNGGCGYEILAPGGHIGRFLENRQELLTAMADRSQPPWSLEQLALAALATW